MERRTNPDGGEVLPDIVLGNVDDGQKAVFRQLDPAGTRHVEVVVGEVFAVLVFVLALLAEPGKLELRRSARSIYISEPGDGSELVEGVVAAHLDQTVTRPRLLPLPLLRPESPEHVHRAEDRRRRAAEELSEPR